MELLPGQYDQQADFSAQCLQILTMGKKPNVRTGTLIVLEGNITDKQLDEIKKYCINPVESREVSTKKPATLKHEYKAAKEIKVLDGFIEKNEDELNDFISELGLAMDLEDLKFCQAYFRDTEKRNPTITEIRVLDTYWSDHCRHSTFLTELCDIKIYDNKIQEVFQDYLKHKDPNKPVCLMDIATSSIKRLKAEGKLDNLDDSRKSTLV